MNQVAKIEVPVEEATASALSDSCRLQAVGRLVRPGADDPLIALLEITAAEAQRARLSDAEVDAELAVYNTERRG